MNMTTAWKSRLTGMSLLKEPAGYVGGRNLYEYVNGMPRSTTDPNGLKPVTLNKVYLIEKIIAVKMLNTQVEITVTGSYFRVTGDVDEGNVTNPEKTPIEPDNEAEKVQKIYRTVPRNVKEEDLKQHINKFILPELPCWQYGGAYQALLAAVGPNSFYPGSPKNMDKQQ